MNLGGIMRKERYGILIILLVISRLSYAQNTDQTLFDKGKTIREICGKIEKIYPDHLAGKNISNSILKNFSSKKYDEINDPVKFADVLTNDIVGISNDVHFGLKYDPELAAKMKADLKNDSAKSDKQWTEELAKKLREKNYGFSELKILDGNTGYLKLNTFFSPKYAGDVAVASMNYFSNCDGLIIDLSDNTGGWDEMGMLLLSYFVDEDEQQIMAIHHSTIDNKYQAAATYAYVPGRRYTDMPVYILVSHKTASAAEGFSYRMRYLHKAIIIGEKTSGAETPIEPILIGDFILQIPCYETVYSISGPGWQGAGITPDIETGKEKSLLVAQKEFISAKLDMAGNQAGELKYSWILEKINSQLLPLSTEEKDPKKFVGQYGKRKIFVKDGSLYYQNENGPEFELIQLGKNLFQFKVTDTIRVEFVMGNSTASGFYIKYEDGYKTALFEKE